MVYVDGVFTHAVLKRPGEDSLYVQEEKGGSTTVHEPTAAALAYAWVSRQWLRAQDVDTRGALWFVGAVTLFIPWLAMVGLSAALFDRTGSPDHGYDAARSRALEGDSSGSLALLRKAVEAGFCDAARVWSDEALEGLHSGETESELAALLPRPTTAE